MPNQPEPLDNVIGALRSFEDIVRSGDFSSAGERLAELTAVLDRHWQTLVPSERAIVDQSVMAGLNWARTFVAANREQTRAQLERIAGAKVYEMSASRRGPGLTLVG